MSDLSPSPLLSGLRRQLHVIWLTIAIPAVLVGIGALWFWLEVVEQEIAVYWTAFFAAMVLITLAVSSGVYRVYRIVRTLQERETQLQTRDQQLITADRLASVGAIAASIAHEVNNPLTTIKILIHSLQEQIPGSEPARADLAMVQEEIDKISTLVLRLMQFARPSEPELVVADLNLTLGHVVELIRPKAQMAGIVIHEHRDSPAPALADPAQLGQVFLNILLNAVDATPQGGTIKVITETKGGGGVVVTIWNSGQGIDPTLYDRIFDPFFTTKATGTGLGLSIAHMIMDKHNGSIRAIGHGAGGTSFRITLPQAAIAKS
jgi:signal transduction histidine kinase